ncbi:hypothetical protein [Haloarcula argentinensis]|nr:hypothetical protein [Haloarcula argentinensis]
MTEVGTGRRQVTRSKRVVCETCEEFEMGKSYRGASATDGELEYADVDLPEECPVCESRLIVTTGGRGLS